MLKLGLALLLSASLLATCGGAAYISDGNGGGGGSSGGGSGGSSLSPTGGSLRGCGGDGCGDLVGWAGGGVPYGGVTSRGGVSGLPGGAGGWNGSGGTPVSVSGGSGGVATRADGAVGGPDSGGTGNCRPAPPCPSGWFTYSDTACSPPYLGSGAGCGAVGDGLCYQRCTTASDCSDPRFPSCVGILWFGGDDTGETKYVCTGDTSVAACPSNTGGAGGGPAGAGGSPGGGGGGGYPSGGGCGGGCDDFRTGGRGGGGGATGEGGTLGNSPTTVVIRDGRIALMEWQPDHGLNGLGWVTLAPRTELTSPTCAGAPITAAAPCTADIHWPSSQGLCVSGSIPASSTSSGTPGDDLDWGMMVGVNATEPPGGGLGRPYKLIFIYTTGAPTTGLRLVVHRKGDADTVTYCASFTSGDRIPFTSFNTHCWDGTGTSLAEADVPSIDQIAIHAISYTSPVVVTDLCFSSIYLQE